MLSSRFSLRITIHCGRVPNHTSYSLCARCRNSYCTVNVSKTTRHILCCGLILTITWHLTVISQSWICSKPHASLCILGTLFILCLDINALYFWVSIVVWFEMCRTEIYTSAPFRPVRTRSVWTSPLIYYMDDWQGIKWWTGMSRWERQHICLRV